jgi:hypothetical protein
MHPDTHAYHAALVPEDRYAAVVPDERAAETVEAVASMRGADGRWRVETRVTVLAPMLRTRPSCARMSSP